MRFGYESVPEWLRAKCHYENIFAPLSIGGAACSDCWITKEAA